MYVLILVMSIVYGGKAASTMSVEFNTRQACLDALVVIKGRVRDGQIDVLYCAKKG